MGTRSQTQLVAASNQAKARSSTRFRICAAAVVLALVAIGGVSVWRMRSAGELPDLGDPFDVREATQPIFIPDEDNAYAGYAQARLKQGDLPDVFSDAVAGGDEDALRWSKVTPDARERLESERDAQEIWREASERKDALFHQPGDYAASTLLGLMVEVYNRSTLAALEGSRLEEQGKMTETWVWYRAMLRSSRMVGRHAGLVERVYGARMHTLAAKRIVRWAQDPRVDAGMLRAALRDAIAADQLTATVSDALKIEYLLLARELSELKFVPGDIPLPGGKDGALERVISGSTREMVQKHRMYARNDVEKSRRIFRFLFRNWLAQVDKPAAERARHTMAGELYLYEFDQSVPEEARRIRAETLIHAIDETLFARLLLHPEERPKNWIESAFGAWEGDGFFVRERRRRSALLVKLAAELYRRENGRAPATAGDLLGRQLKELPEGIAPGDAIPAGVE